MIFCDYEITNRILFMSLKRAKNMLSIEHNPTCNIESFFDYLYNNYDHINDYIEFIAFYEFDYTEKKGKAFKYNIAYIYTKPSLKFRDAFFGEREIITKETGWYPYITGARANFTHLKAEKSYKYWKITKNKPPYVHLGRPLSIKNVASDYAATAMLLKCKKGNILLDTGFGIEEEFVESIDYIFISHFHYDHTGGLADILKKKDIPVIMSSLTLNYMLDMDSIVDEDKKRILKNVIISDFLNNRSYIFSTLEFFESYHCPGSVGVKYKYRDTVVVYAGDICLRNGFYCYKDVFNGIVSKYFKNKYIILDSALVMKSHLSIGEDDFEDVSESLFDKIKDNNALFISKGTEMLFNIYLKLFAKSVLCSKQTNFVVNEDLYKLLKNVLRSWLLFKYRKDPFIKYVLASGRANFAETRRVYPITKGEQFHGKQDVVYILSLKDVEKLDNIPLLNGVDCFLTGPLALENRTYDCIENLEYKSIKRLASSDWSFHSDRKSLENFIVQHKECKFILFHSFPKVLNKFKKSFSDDNQHRIHVLSRENLELT
ncbi:MBL fold metallo-hydrolase [Anaerovorax sp. IOR16]|uniref:MBL fold metallo-hydrolase n=1 Tax=Anaerovorax sp. IOR16 TaxID=2773458 RepID=UPI0019D161EF|nr:MBL fold metallo-hydrolase [Anaerovorax sp. IOR16]